MEINDGEKIDIMKKHKKLKIFGIIILSLILLIVIINQITVYPFVWWFRGMTSSTKEQGNIGIYADVIKQVNKKETINISVKDCPDATVTFYEPNGNKEKLPLVIYIHGGGWTIGSASAVESFAKLISSNGYVVANVDYSLAPEYPYPTSTIQLVEVVNYLYNNAEEYNIEKTNIFIGGNSAGASLSSQLGAIFSNSDYAKKIGVQPNVPIENIKGLLLFNGVYNFNTAGDSNFPFIKKLMWSYTGKKDYLKYERLDELSSIKYINDKYPSVFITVGDIDPLEPQTLELIDELEKNNINYKSLLWIGTNSKLYHDYIYELDTKEAQKAYEMTIDFIESRI